MLCGTFYVRNLTVDEERKTLQRFNLNFKSLDCFLDTLYNYNPLFKVMILGDEIRIPETMQTKLNTWLGNKTELVKEAHHQQVVQVTNKFTGETTHYNPLRAKKPGAQVIVCETLVHFSMTHTSGCAEYGGDSEDY